MTSLWEHRTFSSLMVFLLFSSIWQRALQSEAQIGAARGHPGDCGGHQKTRRHSQAGSKIDSPL